MKFRVVAECFAVLEQEPSRVAMTKLLAVILHEASPTDAMIICNLALGQLYPPYVGTQFGIAEKTMATVIADTLGVSLKHVETIRERTGDLGLVFDEATWNISRELTVKQVYEALQKIEETGGTGSQEQRALALAELFKDLDPLSAKYVVRIVLGKLRLGFSDMTLVDAISWMLVGDKSARKIVEDAYNICADIGLIVAQAKEGGIEKLKHMKIHVGIPIMPAAAERMPTAQAIVEKLGPCVAQLKLDGFRLQIHVWRDKNEQHIRFYSRNLIDMSNMFPDLTAALKKLNVNSVICEGEAIVYDADTDSFLPFQETVKRKRKHNVEEVMQELPLRLFLFDLLYFDGLDCLDMPHSVRRAGLVKLIEPLKSEVIQVVEERSINTAAELEEYFQQAVSEGLEGLVVKKTDAVYQAGKRNFNWVKLKRQQFGHIEDTIDTVILGYYRGSGKRAHFGIGAFLVAVYDKKSDRFETIAKVGTGLKDAGWKELKKKCDAIAMAEKPKNVFCASELEPDVWTSPDLVVSLRADEITLSPLHTAGKKEKKSGFALRFPRFVEYRPDKDPTQATSVDEIARMYKDQWT